MRKLVPIATLLLAGALALHPVVLAEPAPAVIVMGVLALVCFVLALATHEWIMSGPGLVLLLSQYAFALVSRRGELDELAPAFAVGAFLLMELMDVSLTLSRSERVFPEVVGVQARQLVIVAAGGGLVSTIVLTMGGIVAGRQIPFLFAGAAGAALVILLSVRLAQDVLDDEAT